MADTEIFLKKHMCKLIQKIRNPIELADELYGKITKELYANIRSQKTNPDMVREIYGCLNSKTPCDITYDWLKKNESELLEDLGKPLACLLQDLSQMCITFYNNKYFINSINILLSLKVCDSFVFISHRKE